VCASQKLLDQFTESNKLLDSVQKGLANYLETKRLAFARWEEGWGEGCCCTHTYPYDADPSSMLQLPV
jgi:hypothetical protein